MAVDLLEFVIDRHESSSCSCGCPECGRIKSSQGNASPTAKDSINATSMMAATASRPIPKAYCLFLFALRTDSQVQSPCFRRMFRSSSVKRQLQLRRIFYR